MVRPLCATALAALCLLLAGPAAADAAPLSLVSVGSFSQPTFVTAVPSDPSRLYVVERSGLVKVLRDGATSTFVDLRPFVVTDGERGLLSIAFAPDFATSRRLYAYYTGKAPGVGDLTIVRLIASDGDSAPATPEVLLTVPHSRMSNHNGGQLQFGPDGLLYAGTGDGGGGGDPARNGQNLDSSSPAVIDGVNRHPLLGKLLRLDVSPVTGYAIPPANAFGPPSKAPEIFAYGLRNPYRFSFDAATGDLLIGDVGQSDREEVDVLAAGSAAGTNFGWPVWEGTLGEGSREGFTFPALEYTHAAGCSVTGGYVVRDPQVPELAGQYVYGDYCSGRLRAAWMNAAGSTGDRDLGLTSLEPKSLISFGEDACGRLHIATQDGTVQRLVSGGGECSSPRVPGAVPPRPSAPVPAAQRRVPTLSVRAFGTQRAAAGRVRLTLSCDIVCDVRATGHLLLGRQRAGNAPRLVLQPRTTRLDAGARVRVAMRFSAATRRTVLAALRRGRPVSARAVVRASGPGGGQRTRIVRLRVSR